MEGSGDQQRSDPEVDAERAGEPFLLLEADQEGVRIISLDAEGTLTIGRGPNVDLDLAADTEVSRHHAEIRRDGERWAVLDDGMSRNGSFVNEVRVKGWQALEDGDSLRVGRTELRFRDPVREPDEPDDEPVEEVATAAPVHVSTEQKRMLIALCAPLAEGHEGAAPATPAELAEALDSDEATIERELAVLAERYGAGSDDPFATRERVAEVVLRAGVISLDDLDLGLATR